MDLSKRANLRNVREVRLAGTVDVPDAQWRIETPVEFRDDSGDFYTFRGEASVVEHPYVVRDMFGEFTETIKAGAFDKTLRENPDVSFVYMHDMATVMASTRGGGLQLSADPHLAVHAQLPKSDVDVQRFAPKALRGDANAMSFAFRVTQQVWNEDYTDRQITEVNLHRGDVSGLPTGLGANPAAWGTLRSDELDLAFRALRDGTATDEQVDALRSLLPDGGTYITTAWASVGESGDEMRVDDETPEIDPEEARRFMEHLMLVRERQRHNDAA